jgi:tetratricopeptide (TPR) repeat protein
MTHHPNWSFEGLEVVPVGLTFRTVRSGRPQPEPVLPAEELPGESDPRVPKDYLTQNLIGQLHYMRGLTFEMRDWPRAEYEFERARQAAPHNDVLFFNLGLIYTRNGLLDDAERAFIRSNAINPRNLATAGKVRASDKIALTRAERERLARVERALAARADAPAGSPSYHRQMAELLAGAGEPAAARDHWLRAHARPAS